MFAEMIRQRVVDGTYAVGEKLPAETVLIEESGLPQYTVLAALKFLKNSGWLTPEKGSGLFVSPPEKRR
jgi:DNA-binding GntR family transcriptional regulator